MRPPIPPLQQVKDALQALVNQAGAYTISGTLVAPDEQNPWVAMGIYALQLLEEKKDAHLLVWNSTPVPKDRHVLRWHTVWKCPVAVKLADKKAIRNLKLADGWVWWVEKTLVTCWPEQAFDPRWAELPDLKDCKPPVL